MTTNLPTKKKAPDGTRSPRWQQGAYARNASFEFHLPAPFLFLCKLTDTTPRAVLMDFMDRFGGGSSDGSQAKIPEQLIEYFIEMGYGQQLYTTEDIRAMFREMDAMTLAWPEGGNRKLVLLYEKWRDKYHRYWFKKWFRKPRRKC